MSNSKRTTLRSLLIGMLLWLPAAVMAAPVNDTFDHFTTGFPLTGGHRSVECDACHTAGQFRGTPRECASCHNLLTNTGAVVKSSAHIQASNDCETCHSTLAWDDVRRVNHMAVLGNCKSCHTVGGAATSRPPTGDTIHNNLAGRDCIDCHRTSTWMSTHYNHAGAGADCQNCHSVSPGPGGIPATPKHAGHISTTETCSLCHSTRSWMFSHTSVGGDCIRCHDSGASGITQRPRGDFHDDYVGIQCNSCHSTRAWTPAAFRHLDSSFPPDHGRSFSCSTCHGGTPQSAANVNVYDYSNTNERDCIVCHYRDFRKEHSDGEIASKKNCLSGCHEHSMRKW